MMTLSNHPQNLSSLADKDFNFCLLNDTYAHHTLLFLGIDRSIINHGHLRPAHMRKLFELAATPTKIWKPLPGGDHNSSVLEEGYFEAISDFVSNVASDEAMEKS